MDNPGRKFRVCPNSLVYGFWEWVDQDEEPIALDISKVKISILEKKILWTNEV